MERKRRRRHRNALLNQVEQEILMLKEQRVRGQEDFFLWRQKDDTYSDRFQSKETWQILRASLPTWDSHRGIWFSFATPKFAFMTWLAAKNRLATGERMECWNINVHIGCSFCAEPRETREHLFFDSLYSRQIWEALVGGLMGSEFTWEWTNILNHISRDARIDMTLFIVRYAFQATIHSIWIERNRRRHGEKPITNTILKDQSSDTDGNNMKLIYLTDEKEMMDKLTDVNDQSKLVMFAAEALNELSNPQDIIDCPEPISFFPGSLSSDDDHFEDDDDHFEDDDSYESEDIKSIEDDDFEDEDSYESVHTQAADSVHNNEDLIDKVNRQRNPTVAMKSPFNIRKVNILCKLNKREKSVLELIKKKNASNLV
ncbi:hypothetical protein CTI12_AA097900 [Artemisia annua]|uniref:Reverse transcriptase zinc-binding domain-containing protein n=1 Tax=Artemisia annua TaxID=35608 RepID=A0A2U1PY82_ARTAN|nr:hypothetical protein CTI12_AA097900 [Artemisia annua]